MNFLENQIEYYWPIILVLVLFSLGISFLLYPIFAYLSPIRQVRMDKDDSSKPPTGLWGLSMYLVFFMNTIFAFILFDLTPLPISIRIFVFPLLILFFLEIDIMEKKFSMTRKVFNLIAVLSIILLLFTDKAIIVKNLMGVSWATTGLISFFIFLVYIIGLNAFRIIDQVNGLVGGLAIMINFYFGITFIFNKDFHWALISFASLGAILGFLTLRIYYKHLVNVGIGGTLFVWYIIITLGLNYFVSSKNDYPVNDIMTFVALLCYPIVNTIRLFIIRLKTGWTSFEVGKYHLHNYLMSLGLSQVQVAIVLLTYTMLLAFLMETIDVMGINLSLSVLLIFLFLLGFSPLLLVKTENGIKLRLYRCFQNP